MADVSDLKSLLVQLEVDLIRGESELVLVNNRVRSLRRTVEAVRDLLKAMEPGQGEATAEGRQGEIGEERSVVAFLDSNVIAEAMKVYFKPRTAIMKFFAEESREWTLTEMEREMRRRGWLDPSLTKPTEAIRAAARRLAEAERLIERVNKNTYAPLRLGQEGEQPTSQEAVTAEASSWREIRRTF